MKKFFLFLAALVGMLWGYEPPQEALFTETLVPSISKARWLWYQCDKVPAKETAAYRRTIELDEPVASATLNIAFDDSGQLFVNGTEVKPMPPDLKRNDRFCRSYNVPANLWKVGKNVIAFSVYNAENQGGAILLGKIQLKGGRSITVATDKHWKAIKRPADKQWLCLDFDDAQWPAAMELGDVLVAPWRGACRCLLDFMTDEEDRARLNDLLGQNGSVDFLKQEPKWNAEIVWKNGRAAFRINGKIEPPVIYVAGGSLWDRHNADAMMKATTTGIKLIELRFNAERFMVQPGQYDFANLDMDMRRALKLAPDSAFCLAFSMGLAWSDWVKKYPKEIIGYETGPADGQGGQIGRLCSPSMASKLLYDELAAFSEQLTSYLRSQLWYKRVVGLRLSYGVTAEWHYFGMSKDMPDNSQPMTLAFREFLVRKYKNDAALQQAWCEPVVTLKTAKVPNAAQRLGQNRFLRNPKSKDRQVLDYYECQQEVVADLLIYWASCIKAKAPELLIGAYYGYLFHMSYPPEGQCVLFDKVLSNPNIDMLSSPFSYNAYSRWVGGDAQPRTVGDVFKKYGKLMIYEADVRTHIAGYNVPCSSHSKTPEDSVSVVRAENSRAFLMGGGVQYLEFAARYGKQCWFNHPQIWKAIYDSIELWRHLWDEASEPEAQVAVVIRPEELIRQGYPIRDKQSSWAPFCIDYPIHCLQRSGVTCDFMTLQGFLESKHEYRIVFFPNCFSPSPEEREAIKKKVRRTGVVTIWNYAPGLVTEKGFSEQEMGNLCGINLKACHEYLPMGFRTFEGVLFLPKYKEGVCTVSPRCYVDDEQARILGSYTILPEPALAIKKLADGSTSVFCGSSLCSVKLWNMLWKELAVPTNNTRGIVTAGNERHLMIHVVESGEYEFFVPPKYTSAVNHFDNIRYPIKEGKVKLPAQHAETWLLEIQ